MNTKENKFWRICNHKRTVAVFLLISILQTVSFSLDSGSSATQLVQLEVKPIAKIAISGNPGAFLINSTSNDNNSLAVTDANTTYSLTTNVDNLKIIASIDHSMPQGTKLEIKLATGASNSLGFIDVSNALAPVSLVTGINRGKESNLPIVYMFSVGPEVTSVAPQARNITLTLTD